MQKASSFGGKVINMNTFTADSSLVPTLSNLAGLTEVRDSQGQVIGYFSPTSHKSPEAYVQAAAHFNPDEMKQRKLSKEAGRTTSEVLQQIASSTK